MRSLVMTFAMAAVLLGAAAPAAAQEPDKTQEGKYQSPMRAECEAEIEKDAIWNANLRDRYWAEFHEQAERKWKRDKRHVVLAYAALWVLSVLFLGFLYLRQQRLVGEIGRLERDLKRAIAEEEGGTAQDRGKDEDEG